MSTSTKKVPLICSGHSRPVPDIAYSGITPDGFYLISACLDSKPMLRNGETGDWIGTFVGHKGVVWSAHLTQLALKAVTASGDYTVKIWDALSGEEVHTFAQKRIVKSAHFSNDDKRVLSGGQDGILRIYDLAKPEVEPITLEGHTQSIKTCLWLGDDNFIVSGGQDNLLRFWDTRTLKEAKSHPTNANISSIEVSLDGKHLVTTADKEVSFWNSQTFELEKTITVPIIANSASLSMSGNTFVVGGADCTVRVYDYQTGKELELHKGHHGPVHCVRYAPDGNTFASGSEDGTIRILQTELKCYGLWQENENALDPEK